MRSDLSDSAEFHDEDDVPEVSERFRAAMLMAQTPEQQAIAREIYRRLENGAELEDIKPLLEEEMRIVVAHRSAWTTNRTTSPPTGSPAAAPRAQGAIPINGLSSCPEEGHCG